MEAGAELRPAAPGDRDRWAALFVEYAATGGVTLGEAEIARVWSWIEDPSAQTRCVVAVRDRQLVGFVHFRELERPILADRTGYIDDLFVAQSGRGQRLGVRLIEAVLATGAALGWSVVRWTTRQDNAVANHLYPTVARLVPVNTYVADVAAMSS